MKSGKGWAPLCLPLVAGVVCIALVPNGHAQMHTKTTTSTGKSTQVVTVDRAEVVLVAGNDLVLKMEDGTIRHIADVPDSFKATVDGNEVGIYDLKAGMILERTTTITTTPKVVTRVETIKGKVWHVNPPNYIYLTMDNGTNERFEIPKGQKFNVEGQTVDARALQPGMIITATKVVEFTATEVEQQRKLTGSMPPAPPSPPANTPILIAK